MVAVWAKAAERWPEMTFANQMGNAGIDVMRAFSARREGEMAAFATKSSLALALLAATAECQAGEPENLRRSLRASVRFSELLATPDPRGEAALERYFTAWAIRANEERRAAWASRVTE